MKMQMLTIVLCAALSGCMTGEPLADDGDDGRLDAPIPDHPRRWAPVQMASEASPYLLATTDRGLGVYDPVTGNWTVKGIGNGGRIAYGDTQQIWGAWTGSEALFLARIEPYPHVEDRDGWAVWATWNGDWEDGWSVEEAPEWDGDDWPAADLEHWGAWRLDGLAVQDGRVAVLATHRLRGTFVWESPDRESWLSVPLPGWTILNEPSIAAAGDHWVVAGRDGSGRIAVLEGRDGVFAPTWAMLPGDGDASVRVSHAAGTPLLTWINRTSYTNITPGTHVSTVDGGAVHRLHADHVPLSVLGDSELGWVLTEKDRSYSQYRLYEKTQTWRECESDLLAGERISNARLWRFPHGEYLVAAPLDGDDMLTVVSLDSLCP